LEGQVNWPKKSKAVKKKSRRKSEKQIVFKNFLRVARKERCAERRGVLA
jgi:hypothetical protein